jgi:predicted Zn-dependent protease
MAILNESDAQAILKKVLGLSKADECEVTLTGTHAANLRYARNDVSTSGGSDNLSLSVQCSYGKKSGVATLNEFDDASLLKVVRRAEELARLAPDNPEYVPFLGPQKYESTPGFFDVTANFGPPERARAAAASIEPCRQQNLTAAGFLQHESGFSAIANSKGLSGYHKDTGIDFSVTVRTADGRGSGYGVADFNDAAKLDAGAVSRVAIQKAIGSQDTRSIEPGKYTVILEPAASVDLISHLIEQMDARLADEGRSFLTKPGGGTRLGEKLVDERVQISSDPANPEVPLRPWAEDGRPRVAVDWIKNGVVANLAYSRYWAVKKGVPDDKAVPGIGDGFRNRREVAAYEGSPGVIMAGGSDSLDDLVKSVKRGVLVTRMWYIRPVDPQTVLYTGLTRDGTFYIENGEIKYAVKNFRFNESPVIMLNNIEALGKPMRANGCLVPPMVVRDFTFSSLSDAV